MSSRQVGVDDGVLDVGVSKPVLHEPPVGTGVKQVGGDRMFEDVEVLLVLGQLGFLAVALYKPVESSARDGLVAHTCKENRGVSFAVFEVSLDGFDFIRLQGGDVLRASCL